MPQLTTVTRKGRCWKQHKCVGCEAVFRYKLEWTRTENGATLAEAEQRADRLLDQSLANGIGSLPCPHCGIYQPEMISAMLGWPIGCLLLIILFITFIVMATLELHVADSSL